MTVAEPAARPTPPTPEECEHPSPVRGVLAHEFGPYRNASGPEGRRRTTMHYGPVVGGLLISAWHCEECGLLRLDHPDGRREERRLFPGPQPGLMAIPVAEVVTAEAQLGIQARVSGASLSAELAAELIPESQPITIALPRVDLPPWGLAVYLSILLITATIVMLVVGMIGAVAGSTTPAWEGSLFAAATSTFGVAVLLPVAVLAFRHFFPAPPLSPSPAVVHRGKPQLDGVTAAVVTILVVVTAGLGLAGLLSVYDWRTPGSVGPLVLALMALFGLGVLLALAGVVARHLTRR